MNGKELQLEILQNIKNYFITYGNNKYLQAGVYLKMLDGDLRSIEEPLKLIEIIKKNLETNTIPGILIQIRDRENRKKVDEVKELNNLLGSLEIVSKELMRLNKNWALKGF